MPARGSLAPAFSALAYLRSFSDEMYCVAQVTSRPPLFQFNNVLADHSGIAAVSPPTVPTRSIVAEVGLAWNVFFSTQVSRVVRLRREPPPPMPKPSRFHA